MRVPRHFRGSAVGRDRLGDEDRRRALPFNLSIAIRSAWDIPIRSDQDGPQDGSFVSSPLCVSHRPRFLVSASGRPCGPHNWLFHLWLVQVLLEAPNPGWDGEHPSNLWKWKDVKVSTGFKWCFNICFVLLYIYTHVFYSMYCISFIIKFTELWVYRLQENSELIKHVMV